MTGDDSNTGSEAMGMGSRVPVHVIVITHTPKHLDLCLRACCMQNRRPESLTVSCDVLSEEIAAVVRAVAVAMQRRIVLVQRAHTGKARCSQVRNNAVRELMKRGVSVQPASQLVFLDGDTCPRHDAIAKHAALGGGERPVSAFRVNLTEAQTALFDVEKIGKGVEPVHLAEEQTRELKNRDARYRRQAFWRGIGLGKAHKPRLIGGHFSVPLTAYLEVNGCDEEYEGYGQEDDDLTRRLYRAGWRTVVGVNDILVYHLWHPTRAPGNWHDAPGVRRFLMNTPTRVAYGVDRPVEQPEVCVQEF